MQIDSHIHTVNQSLKCLIFDCFSTDSTNTSNPKQSVITGNGFIVKSLNQGHAQIYVFSNEYSHIHNIIKIDHFQSINNVKFSRIKQNTFVVYPSIQSITLKVINQESKEQHFIQEKVHLKQGEKFQSFSQIMRLKHYFLLVGYTTFNNFYLITIKSCKKLEVFKLTNKAQTINFLSWFKNNPLHMQCKKNFLYTYRIDQSDKFILLFTLKDKNMSLYLLELCPQQHRTTMELVGSCDPLQKIIPNSAIQRQVVIMTKDSQTKHLDCLVSYQLKEGFMLILSVHINHKKKNILDVSVLFEDLPSSFFSISYNHSNMLYSFYSKEENIFKVFKKKYYASHEKRNFDNKQVQLFLNLKQRPYFFHIQDELFINTCSQVYLVQAQHIIYSQESDLSELQLHLAEFKNEINHTYRKQVHKLLKKNPIPVDQINYLLTQKCRKIVQWIKNQFSDFSAGQEHTYLILTLEITITIATRSLIMIANFDELLKLIKTNQPNFCMKELVTIIANSEISSVINLLNIITQVNPGLINLILQGCELQEEIRQNCKEAIKTVFTDSFESIYEKTLANGQFSQKMEKIIRTIIVYQLGNPKIYQQISVKYRQFFKKCIMQNKVTNLFSEYFFIIEFSSDQIKIFAHSVYESKRQNLKKLIIEIISKCKKLLKKRQLKIQKIVNLIEGFLQYSHEIMPQMKKNFPGLLFFYYMRTGYKRQGIEYIKELTKKESEGVSEEILQSIFNNLLSQQVIHKEKDEKSHSQNFLQDKNCQIATIYQQILSIGIISEDEQNPSQHSVGSKKIKSQ